jgi:hypothetical protein
LLKAAWVNRPNGFPMKEADYRLVLIQIFGRTFSTFRSVVSLLRDGLPLQALMLCRSLYEDLIAAHWCSLPQNQEEAFGRVVRQERHSREHYLRAASGGYGLSIPESRMSEKEWKELNAEFSGGRKSWFGSLGDARRDVLESLSPDQEDEARTIRYMGEILNRRANMALHNTVKGLFHRTGKPVKYRDGVYFTYGQNADVDEQTMRDAFLFSWIAFVRVARLLYQAFDVDGTRLSVADARANRAVLELMPSQRRKNIGPNDVCWCESGLKLKKCHTM